jgi:hypothetical protein
VPRAALQPRLELGSIEIYCKQPPYIHAAFKSLCVADMQELRKHLLTLGIFCLAVRATPYLLQAAHSRSSY